jgi:hypothetical protein
MYNKTHTLKTRKVLSESHLGEKNNQHGKIWWTNGKKDIISKECPEGFWKGRCSVEGYMDIQDGIKRVLNTGIDINAYGGGVKIMKETGLNKKQVEKIKRLINSGEKNKDYTPES